MTECVALPAIDAWFCSDCGYRIKPADAVLVMWYADTCPGIWHRQCYDTRIGQRYEDAACEKSGCEAVRKDAVLLARDYDGLLTRYTALTAEYQRYRNTVDGALAP